MLTSIAFVAALAASISAAPTPSESAALAPRAVPYKQYTGNGSPAAGWPTIQNWLTFDNLWSINAPLMAQSCGNNGWGANDSPTEIDNIRSAIRSVSSANGIDERFTLAIMMEESGGCVRVPTTVSPDGRVRNPGLMQDHNGSGTCAGRNPCPASEITQMIKDGVAGTSSGDGLKQTVAASGRKDAQGYYYGARKYNSGSVNPADLSQAYGSNPNYASDIANRLLGWYR